ncbi:hypothetical protein CG723_29495 [Streptomyces sp. CB01635]|uniref:hypothetical protein n=1 Tax=unclassified Streptomyces TaxID=2593676 RepID=UPI000C27DBBE|nr:hypothetical protein [Streptomyces sp. CB01635]PJN08142.1 hypothetical protein CG723_29495 [Streptomyces sp. CB01635]
MGTSSRWPGPRGNPGTPAGEWSRVSQRLSSWRSGRLEDLEPIAEDCLGVLHRTLRADPSAFGLRDTARAAGERLTTAMDSLAAGPGTISADGPPDPLGADPRTDFAARLVRAVGGEGGTVADAAVRRAAAATADRMATRHPEVLAADGKGWSGDLLCLLYQWFFADVVAEFLRAVVAEKIKLVVPVLPLADPEDHIADWVAGQVLHLVPNPCEEAARLVEAAEKAGDVVAAFEDPTADSLTQVARGLVPRAVGSVLGLLTPSGAASDENPGALSNEGTPAA